MYSRSQSLTSGYARALLAEAWQLGTAAAKGTGKVFPAWDCLTQVVATGGEREAVVVLEARAIEGHWQTKLQRQRKKLGQEKERASEPRRWMREGAAGRVEVQLPRGVWKRDSACRGGTAGERGVRARVSAASTYCTNETADVHFT
jgi:hypothetical protein